jgi:putative transposase
LRIIGLPRAFCQVARRPPVELAPRGQERFRWLSCWQALREKGFSSSEASLALVMPRSTFYRWKKRLEQEGPLGLDDKSRKPRRRRQPTWSPELARAVLQLREQYPRWGKDKLVVLLRREGWQVSTSMVGRILKRLKEREVLREPIRSGISVHRRAPPRPYAVRKPKDYLVRQPVELVQVDTLDVRPLPGVAFKHFTARDVISRWDVIEAHSQATARAASRFLDTLQERLPFPLRAIQVDGGSEFQALFEEECQRRSIRLFVLPPRSPELNGSVERAHRTHTEEFYEVQDFPLDMPGLNLALEAWERTYNTIRPHQALDWRTPEEYLKERHPGLAQLHQLSHM